MSMMNPLAGPSGPGDKSTRTDLPPSKEYGERKQTKEYIQGATLAKTRGSADNLGGRPANPVAKKPLTPLYAPTEQTNVPSTYGVDTGEGAGSEVLMMNQPDDTNFRSSIASYMPVLNYIAQQPNTSPETRSALRQLRDQL